MSDLVDLLLLLALLAIVGSWLKLSRARELAIVEARRQCQRHGLQLLDETVGLGGLRLRRIDGQRRLERRYDFEVSIDGDDREPGRLWLVGDRLTGLSLPTIEAHLQAAPPEETDAGTTPGLSSLASDNVIPLRPRLRGGETRH